MKASLLALPSSLPTELDRATARGWKIFPCGQQAKKPLLKNWPSVATDDLDQLKEWAAEFHGCNWGAVTGFRSGMFAVDVDGQVGLAALADHARQGRGLPETLTVSTGRGSHLYFQLPDGVHIGNSAGRLARGLDVRGERGYCIVPPSSHETGAIYAYDNHGARIASAPDWLLQLIVNPAVQPGKHNIAAVYEGRRNDALTRLAGALRRRGANFEKLRVELLHANEHRCIPPLPHAEVEQIARSVSKYQPGGLDPLEIAWKVVLSEIHPRGYEQFLALCSHLQADRAGLPIALPVMRVGKLFGVDRRQISRWKHYAVRDGYLTLVDHYVRQVVAARYAFNSSNCPPSSFSDLKGHAARGTPTKDGGVDHGM